MAPLSYLLKHIPAGLSLLRLLAIPWVVALARRGARGRWCLAVAMLVGVDLADGIIARRIGDPIALLRQRRLDALADLALCVAAPLGARRLRPDLLREEALPIACFGAAQTASLIACLARFGRLPRYHTVAYKWSAGALGAALAGRVAGGLAAGFFRPAIGALTLAHLEALLITLLLDAYRQPVRSAWYVQVIREEKST